MFQTFLSPVNYSNINKILSKIEKDAKKNSKNYDKIFDYYIPSTVNIVDKYDEIENQNLSSKESLKLQESSKKLIREVKQAYEKLLNNLYESDIIDMDAEVKVFNSVIKSDGLDNNELKVEDKDE